MLSPSYLQPRLAPTKFAPALPPSVLGGDVSGLGLKMPDFNANPNDVSYQQRQGEVEFQRRLKELRDRGALMEAGPPQAPQQSSLQALIDAIGAQGKVPAYEPPPPYMPPKINPWGAAIAAILALSDPSQQTGPAIAQGFMNGAQQRSQNEAQRRQAEVESKQRQAQIGVHQAQVRYQDDQAKESAAAKLESEKVKAEGRKELEAIKALMKSMPPAARPSVAAAYGVAGAQAWQELTADEQFKIANAGKANATTERTKALLPLEQDYMKAGTSQRESSATVNKANASYTNARESDMNATQPGRIKALEVGNDKKEEDIKMGKAKRSAQEIANKYADQEHKVKIAEIEARTQKHLADAANKKLTGAGPVGKGGKPITDTAALSNWRIISQNSIKAQAEVDTADANISFWDKEVSRLEDADDEDALADAKRNAEFNRSLRDAALKNKSNYDKQLSEFKGKVSTSQGASGGDSEYQAATSNVQKLLDAGKITKADANKRWAAIKAAAGKG